MSGHHPPHVYLDKTCYAVTSATFVHQPVFGTDAAKALLRDTLRSLAHEFRIELYARVVLDNHYHLLLRTQRGDDVSRFFARLHGNCSRRLNLLERTPGRQVWHNFWESCVRSEEGFWMRVNYIHNNPIKHGYTTRMEGWAFSSYKCYLREKGAEWLCDCWLRYPVIDFVQNDV